MSGIVYVADTGNDRVRKIDASFNVTTITGTGSPGFAGDGGPAGQAQLSGPAGLALDASGTLYICDVQNQRVRAVSVSSLTISTFAGNGTAGFSGDNAAATSATLDAPFGIATNTSAGLVLITDSGDGSGREVH